MAIVGNQYAKIIFSYHCLPIDVEILFGSLNNPDKGHKQKPGFFFIDYNLCEKYDDAIGTLERFIKLNPGNENVPYGYYLIALSYYNQISSVDRDQGITIKARKALGDVASRYPDSDYGRDSRFKLDLVEDHLAGKEMTVGRYYQTRKRYIGAINRFKSVVEEYPTTAQVEEALHRLVECYLSLGVIPEAQKYAAVLGANYPDSPWYKDSYDLLIGGKLESSGSSGSSSAGESWYKVW
jgi:outer membrane protein assembly factor BamD